MSESGTVPKEEALANTRSSSRGNTGRARIIQND